MDKKALTLVAAAFGLVLLLMGQYFLLVAKNYGAGLLFCAIPVAGAGIYLFIRFGAKAGLNIKVTAFPWQKSALFIASYVLLVPAAVIFHKNDPGIYKVFFFIFMAASFLVLMIPLASKETEQWKDAEYSFYPAGIMALKVLAYLLALGLVFYFFRQRHPWYGSLAAAVAVLQTSFMLRERFPQSAPAIIPEENAKAEIQPVIGIFLMAVSFGLLMFNLLMPALIVFLPAAYMLSGTKAGTTAPYKIPERFDVLILVILTVIALLIRLYKLGSTPAGVSLDEGIAFGDKAAQIMRGAWYDIFFPDNALQVGSLYYYMLAGFSKIFGLGIVSARAMSAVAGAVTVPLMYLLGRELFGRRAALISAAMTAFAYVHIMYSRMAWLWIFVPMFAVTGFWLLLRGMRTGRNIYFAIAGALTGLNLYFYNAAKLAPFIIVIFILTAVLGSDNWKKSLKRNIPGLVILALSAFAVFLPLLDYILNHTAEYFNRVKDQSLVNFATLGQNAPMVFKLLVENFTEIMLMFTNQSSKYGYFNLELKPLFSYASSFLILIGAGYAVFNWRKKGSAFTLIWIFAALIACYFSTHGEGPKNTQRAILAIQGVIMLAALGAEVLWSAIERLGAKKARVTATAVVLAVFAVGAADDIDTYFDKYAKSIEVKAAYYYAGISADENVIADNKDSDIYLSRFVSVLPSVQNLIWDIKNVKYVDMSVLGLSKYYSTSKKDAFIFAEGIYSDFIQIYKEYFPDCVIKVRPNPDYERSDKNRHFMFRDMARPDVFYVTCRIPYSDIQQAFGLTAYDTMAGGKITERKTEAVFSGMKGSSSTEVRGLIDISEYGRYTIKAVPEGSATVLIDGREAVNRELYQGLHRIKVVLSRPSSETPVSLIISDRNNSGSAPVPVSMLIRSDKIFGLNGSYSVKGVPAGRALDPVIDHRYYYYDLRLHISSSEFDVKWTGTINPGADGEYEFFMDTPYKSSVIINGVKVFDRESERVFDGSPVKLKAYGNKIEVNYHYFSTAELLRNPTSFVRLLYKTADSAERKPVPYTMLKPQ